MSARGVLRIQQENRLAFWCPGCEEFHSVVIGEGRWTFNDDYDKPTFQPSVLVTSGHYVKFHNPGDPCWCTYNAEHGEERDSYQCIRCHSFVTDGQIQFLSDSTHSLSGQSVTLTERIEP